MSDEEIKKLRENAKMLGVISSYVSDFCRAPEDTTLICVQRLLRDYHYAKAENAGFWLEKEGGAK